MGYEPYNSPAKLLFKDILSRGEAAINQYRQSRKNGSGEALNEARVNALGYWLLGKQKVQEAIEVFKMNSSNAYDSLGEAYMIYGDKELALRNYQESLELDPKNANAIEMIKKLQNR